MNCADSDVDDLKEGKGAEYVDASSVSLIFCSKGYFASPNCMREILRAVVTGKPMVALLEPEASHGGMTQEQIYEQLVNADAPCERWHPSKPKRKTRQSHVDASAAEGFGVKNTLTVKPGESKEFIVDGKSFHVTGYASMYEMWGLAAEVTSWGYYLPNADQLYNALFTREPIEWIRIGAPDLLPSPNVTRV